MFKASAGFFKRNRTAATLTSIGAIGLITWKVDRSLDKIARSLAMCEQQHDTPFFHVGVMNNPKFDKRYKGGEDGFVVAADQRMIMVADGVGGWTRKDVDPGKYSKFLCK